jgi:cytochrome d ubiquinol oxidase subunit II
MPFLDIRISELWFSKPNFYYFLPIAIITAFCFNIIWKDLLRKKREIRPFLIALAIFFLCYLGLGIIMWPWIVPFNFNIWEAAAVLTSQSLLLIGTAIFLPIILCYTAYSYYVFRGKSDHNAMY